MSTDTRYQQVTEAAEEALRQVVYASQDGHPFSLSYLLYLQRLMEDLKALPKLKSQELQQVCDTCDGIGDIFEESQAGVVGAGGPRTCPDCDGAGKFTSRVLVVA